MTTSEGFFKRYPIIIAVIAVIVALTGIARAPRDSYFSVLVARAVLCGFMLFFLWLVSGQKTLSQISHQTGYVIKSGIGFWIFSLVLGLLGFSMQMKTAGGLPEGWLSRAMLIFFMFLFACLFEELCFRAILNDAIVYQFRNAKHVFLMSAVISSLVFGASHCLGSSLTSGLAWAQAVMKTLECAIFGFAMLILYWKTRNILACGILHAGFDLFTSLVLIFQSTPELGAGTYVRADKAGSMVNIIVYPVFILIVAVITWRIWEKVGKTIDFEEMRKNW